MNNLIFVILTEYISSIWATDSLTLIVQKDEIVSKFEINKSVIAVLKLLWLFTYDNHTAIPRKLLSSRPRESRWRFRLRLVTVAGSGEVLPNRKFRVLITWSWLPFTQKITQRILLNLKSKKSHILRFSPIDVHVKRRKNVLAVQYTFFFRDFTILKREVVMISHKISFDSTTLPAHVSLLVGFLPCAAWPSRDFWAQQVRCCVNMGTCKIINELVWKGLKTFLCTPQRLSSPPAAYAIRTCRVGNDKSQLLSRRWRFPAWSGGSEVFRADDPRIILFRSPCVINDAFSLMLSK